MTGSWNSSESNQPFSKKRERYTKSKIRMLNEVASESKWGPAKIDERENRMLDFLLDRWPDVESSEPSLRTERQREELLEDLN